MAASLEKAWSGQQNFFEKLHAFNIHALVCLAHQKRGLLIVTTVTYHINGSNEILLSMNCLTPFYKESALFRSEGSYYTDFSSFAKVAVATFTSKPGGPAIKSKLRLVKINEQSTFGDEVTSTDLYCNFSLYSLIRQNLGKQSSSLYPYIHTQPNFYWDKFSVRKPAHKLPDFL